MVNKVLIGINRQSIIVELIYEIFSMGVHK
jgi:hypothetical protein